MTTPPKRRRSTEGAGLRLVCRTSIRYAPADLTTTPCILAHGRRARSNFMPDSVFDAFTEFFDDIPDVVRHELCVLLVTLADEGSAERGADYEREARALFNARSQVGRFGDLINAVAVFDVYFAADAGKRFEPTGPRRNVIPGGNGSRDAAQSRYGDRLSAIATAQRRWRELRNTT